MIKQITMTNFEKCCKRLKNTVMYISLYSRQVEDAPLKVSFRPGKLTEVGV